MQRLHFFSLLLGCVLAVPVAAQGSQRPLGGGCSGRSTPTVSGQLAIGTTLQIDDPGCFLGQGGFGAIAFGQVLTTPIPLPMRSSVRGVENCLVMVMPLVMLDVTSARFPIVVPIPNQASLVGARIGLQAVCHECGFAGCFDLLTQGLEIVIG